MGNEPPSNVGMVCADHAPRPQEKYLKREPQSFVGHFVKKTFIADNGRPEHMWVEVIDITSTGGLVGRLNNDPILPFEDLKDGDLVSVALSEIEEELDPKTEEVG